MPDHDPAYVAGLAGQLRERPALDRNVEDDLALLRQRLATVARFLHNPRIALDIRQGLARDLQLPEPNK